jgi:hypothetical protein
MKLVQGMIKCVESLNWRILSLLSILLIQIPGFAQSTNAPLNEDYYHWIDRYEIKAGRVAPELFTSLKQYKRSSIIGFIDSLNSKDKVFSSPSDLFNYAYLRNDSWEWSRAETSNSAKPFLRQLYKKKSDFLFVDKPEFDLHVNPVLYLGLGKDSRTDETLFINTRGLEIRGMVDRKVGFYTYIGENQSILPSYVREEVSKYSVLPHEGFWKPFKTNGVDYFHARGYLDFDISKHIYMQFGHDRIFIGNGYRSLIFSDYAPPSQYLKANLKVWKLNYVFQLNRMTAENRSLNNAPYPTKYVAFHHLSFNVGKKLNFGLFESVVFGDSAGRFEFNYLNPVIFYRAIEHQNGSADNAILGADFKWNAVKYLSFYGQVVIDEFLLDNVKAGTGWWANKFAYQAGLKYIDVARIQNLDVQVEANLVRPYTYSHATNFTNYTNYLQPLAHPIGANFYELAAIIRYQPVPKLNLVLKNAFIKVGRDGTNENWGGDVNKSYNTRQQDFGNTVAQGVENKISFIDFTASYMLKHNFFIDLKQTIRRSESSDPFYNNNTSVTQLVLRLNIAQRLYEF